MEVTVLYITNVKEATGKPEERVIFEGDTLGQLLHHLSAAYGPGFSATVLTPSGDDISDYVAVLINGQSYHTLGNLGARLRDDDTVLMGMTMAGGC
ncbi:MAG: MoaD/ThiS family protein [Dehalococcoidia bacterium]